MEFRLDESHYRLMFESCGDAMLLTTLQGKTYRANPAACRMFGKTEQELCRGGRAGIVDLGDPKVAQALKERRTQGGVRAELTFIRGDGSKFCAECTSTIFTDDSGSVLTVMVIRDVTSYKQKEESLLRTKEESAFLATYDFLTGALNRGSFIQKLREEMSLAGQKGSMLSLMMADIDYFKKINDLYGHLCGDAVLKSFTECLLENLRPGDFLGRFGGDEFVTCLAGTSAAKAGVIAERLRGRIEELKVYTHADPVRITASIGAAQYDAAMGTDTDAFLVKVDRYMYEAKAQRNCVVSETSERSKKGDQTV